MAAKASFTDEARILGLQKGDRQAVQSIYEDYFPRISAFIHQNSGSEDEARDIFQDALVILYKKVRQPGFLLSSALFTFFYAICRNLWLKKLRDSDKERVTSEVDQEYMDENVDEEELQMEAQRQLYRKKLREISESCQQLLKLSLAGKRMREIVDLMGMSSEQYARKRKFQCKEQLIRLIREDSSYDSLRYGAP